MRITTKIAATGVEALTRIPLPRYTMAECVGPDGKLDPAKAQLAFAGTNGGGECPFMPASTDDIRVYFAALAFCDQLATAYDAVCARTDSNCHRAAETKTDRQLERKMDRGKFAYSRCNVAATAEGVRVTLSYANPNGTVGGSEAEARGYTTMCAQIWLRIAAGVDRFRTEVVADPEILAEAKRRNETAELRNRRAGCSRLRNGFCSPCDRECPLYANGRCREP